MKEGKNRKAKNTAACKKRGTAALIFLLALLLVCLAAPLLPGDPNLIDLQNRMAPPSLLHWFGTDELGRDYFLRTLYGGRVSLAVGVASMITSGLLGTAVGMCAGYFGGAVDSLLMRGVDVLCAVPWIILVTVAALFLKPGLLTIVLVIGLFSWMELARLVRAETLSLKQREYVLFARQNGAGKGHILLFHILPGVLPTVIVACTSNIAAAILTESSLSFLGMGVQPPLSSWGSLLQGAQASLASAPHMAFLPGFCIVGTVLAFNCLGDLLQTFFDPRGGEKE